MASFGPTDQMNAATNTLTANNTAASGAALPNVSAGTSNLASGANFFRNILGGNQADTTALLQPDINRINAANQQTLQGVSTLTPRGGGRSSSLFALPFQGNQQIQSLFNGLRGQAAQALPSIGAQQGSLGSNLFDISNTGSESLGKLGLAQQEFTDAQKWKLFRTIAGGLAGGMAGGAGGAGGGA